MSQFYKMDPAAWDFGTSDLSLEEEAAYLRIVNAIHKHDAPVPNNDRVLAGLFRSSTRKARTLLDALLAARKVVIEDGAIWNDRARSDLVRRGFTSVSRSESGAKGGRTRAENAAKALENNDVEQAIASSRIEKNREEDIEHEGKPSCPAPSDADTDVPPEQKPKPEPKARLPADWVLSDEGWAYARSQKIPDEVINDEAKGFHAYWSDRRDRDASKSARGWEQCWANRCRAVAQRYQRSGFMAGQATAGRGGSGSSIASIVAQRWLGGSHG